MKAAFDRAVFHRSSMSATRGLLELAQETLLTAARFLSSEDAFALSSARGSLRWISNEAWRTRAVSEFAGLSLNGLGAFEDFAALSCGKPPCELPSCLDWKNLAMAFLQRLSYFDLPAQSSLFEGTLAEDEDVYLLCCLQLPSAATRFFFEVEAESGISFCLCSESETGDATSVSFYPLLGVVLHERAPQLAGSAIESRVGLTTMLACEGESFSGRVAMHISDGAVIFGRKLSSELEWTTTPWIDSTALLGEGRVSICISFGREGVYSVRTHAHGATLPLPARSSLLPWSSKFYWFS